MIPNSFRKKRDRGLCPICARLIGVDVVGRLVEHGLGAKCEGTGQMSKKDHGINPPTQLLKVRRIEAGGPE